MENARPGYEVRGTGYGVSGSVENTGYGKHGAGVKHGVSVEKVGS